MPFLTYIPITYKPFLLWFYLFNTLTSQDLFKSILRFIVLELASVVATQVTYLILINIEQTDFDHFS